jgi:hypothetical protein
MMLAERQRARAAPGNEVSAPLVLQRCGGTRCPAGTCAHPEDELHLQRRSLGGEDPDEIPPIVHDVLRSNGHPLDPSIRALMESRFSRDFADVHVSPLPKGSLRPKGVGPPDSPFEAEADRVAGLIGNRLRADAHRDTATRPIDFRAVRIHDDDLATSSARFLYATAYTVGNHIAFDRSFFAPHTADGQGLLAHELTHVLQQSGRPAVTVQRKLSKSTMEGADLPLGLPSDSQQGPSGVGEVGERPTSTLHREIPLHVPMDVRLGSRSADLDAMVSTLVRG